MLDFYYIDNAYIQYLRTYDTQVSYNKNEKRPYIGIVFYINGIEYYAPLSSPKPKHKTMKNSKDLRKINGGQYGVINFNNMIPVSQGSLIHIDINSWPDPKHRRFLQKQYFAIQADYHNIIKTANELYQLVTAPDDKLTGYELTVKQRCCNFALLESIYLGYK